MDKRNGPKKNETRNNLNSECENLERIIERISSGDEKCNIDNRFSIEEALDYLQDYLQDLNELNRLISEQGNTPENMKQVNDMYSKLWMFQLYCTVESLPRVIGGLLHYPNNTEL